MERAFKASAKVNNFKDFFFLFKHVSFTLSLDGALEGRNIKYIE
jgi:hypothetical protein